MFSSPMAISQSKSSRSPAVKAPKLMLPCKRILGFGFPMFKRFFGISVWMPNSWSFLRQSCKKSRSSAPRIKIGSLARRSRYASSGLKPSAMPLRTLIIESSRESLFSNSSESGVRLAAFISPVAFPAALAASFPAALAASFPAALAASSSSTKTSSATSSSISLQTKRICVRQPRQEYTESHCWIFPGMACALFASFPETLSKKNESKLP